MADEHSIARYRRWYRKLIHFYSKAHRERFGESMEQTFNDVCRERVDAGQGLGGFVLWLFVETFKEILRENGRSLVMQNKRIVGIAIVAGGLLLVPLMGNLFMGWSWPWFAFPVWGAILFGAGLTFELIARQGGTAYRVATGIACATGFVLLFMNAAVGIIGDGPVNLLYLGVLATAFGGALVARFQPRGMALAMLATAAAQMLVPAIALVLWQAGWNDLLSDPSSPYPPFHPGVGPVFGLNGVFAALWVVAALLFRHAGNSGSTIRGESPGSGARREGLAG